MGKILLIEDDPLIFRMYQRLFTSEGYEVELAVDGEEGLAKARSILPTIILLDVMMPKLNGLQVLEQLKADATTKAIPVVMLTNLVGEQHAEIALKAGAAKYIVKSEYEPEQIITLIKDLLSKPPTQTQVGT